MLKIIVLLHNFLETVTVAFNRVISKGPCDTEDWSNVAEYSALITGIKYILNIIIHRKNREYALSNQ